MNTFIFLNAPNKKKWGCHGPLGAEKKMCSWNKAYQASKLQLKPSTAMGIFLGSSCPETGFQKQGVELQCTL